MLLVAPRAYALAIVSWVAATCSFVRRETMQYRSLPLSTDVFALLIIPSSTHIVTRRHAPLQILGKVYQEALESVQQKSTHRCKNAHRL
jgi:hypothetical protein